MNPPWRALVILIAIATGIGVWLLSPPKDFREVESRSGRSSVNTIASSHADNQLAVLTTASAKQESQLTELQLDPKQDGWETEAVAESAKQLLLRLSQRLGGASIDKVVAGEVDPQVRCGPLRPTDLVETFKNGDEGQLLIRESRNDTTSHAYQRSREAFALSLDELAQPFANAKDVHAHFKVVRISMTSDTAETTALYEADGNTPDGVVQQRATWHCIWRRLPDGKLQLSSIRAEKFREVVSRGPWFVDCTRSVLDRNSALDEQLAFGINHWLTRLGKIQGMHVFARNGLALGDVNGDGLDDVYVCQAGGLPNRLFIQQPDGTAIDGSHDAGVDWLDQTSSALLLDLDNDGDQDLVAATISGVLIMENEGTGKFELRNTLATRDTDTQSISAADFDQDGDLDLYVCIEFARELALQYEGEAKFVYHNANDGAPNALFRNDIADDSWKFTNVTKETGLDEANRRHSLACAWEDFDNDGDQDLYVANDYGQNCLYENNQGKFNNIAAEAKVVDSASGMSVSWGDYDRDGLMDLYVANMFSSAGNRITRQQQFKASADDQVRGIYSRFAKGNTLFKNNGVGHFEDTGQTAGVEMARWAWSSVFADVNNDTFPDLLVANGYISTEDSGDL